MTWTTTTHAICTSEHGSALAVVFHVSLMMCHTTWAEVHWIFHFTSSACRTCIVVFDSLRFFSLIQRVFHRFLPLVCPDVPLFADRSLRPRLRGIWLAPLRQGEPRRLRRHPFHHTTEFVNSKGFFSYVIPSSDLDIDDTTLGKLLDQAHRQYAENRSPESVFVSQSFLFVLFHTTGKLVGSRNVDPSIGFGVARNTYSAHSKFPENTQGRESGW